MEGAISAALRSLCTVRRYPEEYLRLEGLDCDKYTIKKIENGSRAVTDIELKIFAKFFHTTADDLLHEK